MPVPTGTPCTLHLQELAEQLVLTGPVWVLGKAAVVGRLAHPLPRLPPGSSSTFHVQGLQKTSYYSLPRGGVQCDASVPTACGTQECLDLSTLEVTDVREEVRSASGVVHPPTGSQSLGILC